MTSPATPVTPDEALAGVLDACQPLPELMLTLAEAHGCTITSDVFSPNPLPPADTALVDGYACRLADVVGSNPASPRVLPVIGDTASGDAQVLSVQPGFSVRVSAGSALPPGAELVVPTTWTDGGLARVAVLQAPEAGGWMRRAGSELAEGALMIPAGSTLAPAQVALAASAGRTNVPVRPRPRVVVLSGGAGVVDPGQARAAGQVPDATGPALVAAARDAGALGFRGGVLPADPRRLLDALEDHLIRADLLIIAGGLSGAGGREVLRGVLGREGTLQIHTLAAVPGGTVAWGHIGPDKVPFLGLPGQPLAALVTFALLGVPAVRRMAGRTPEVSPAITATLGTAVRSPVGQTHLVRARLEATAKGWVATPLGGAHPLAAMAEADALVVLAPETTDVPAGTPVTAIRLPRVTA